MPPSASFCRRCRGSVWCRWYVWRLVTPNGALLVDPQLHDQVGIVLITVGHREYTQRHPLRIVGGLRIGTGFGQRLRLPVILFGRSHVLAVHVDRVVLVGHVVAVVIGGRLGVSVVKPSSIASHVAAVQTVP